MTVANGKTGGLCSHGQHIQAIDKDEYGARREWGCESAAGESSSERIWGRRMKGKGSDGDNYGG